MIYLDIVIVEEENHSNIVFEGNNMGFWKDSRAWHICLGSIEGTKNVFGQPNLVQL